MSFVDIRPVDSLDQCWWYHSLDFPDGTGVTGDWDLRGRFGDYTGNVDVAGKRVLDVGTASGFFAFNAERQGAKVVAFDMPVNGNWDTVPFADEPVAALKLNEVEARLQRRRESEATRYKRESAIDTMRNGFMYAHRKYASSVRLFEGAVYEIGADVGIFDVSILGAILLHLRDPFLALHRVAQITTKQLVISDLCEAGFRRSAGDKPLLEFLPDAEQVNIHAWWRLSPGAMAAMLRVVGFAVSSETIRAYKFKGRDLDMVTLVAERIAV
jgi:hypothetical protein